MFLGISASGSLKGKVKMKVNAPTQSTSGQSTISHSDNSDDGSVIKKRGRKKRSDGENDQVRYVYACFLYVIC